MSTDNFVKIISKKEIVQLRNQHIGKVSELFYDNDPLQIIKAHGQYMYNEKGVKYLDCINNVAHVGHCHPDVVKAEMQQASTVNTNSRFLNDNLVAYAQKLTSLFPEPLSICFFVNSGSEANDLALQLARYHTNHSDIITVEHAYHGNSSSLINLSTYKSSHLDNFSKPDWVHVAPCPDIYRGKYVKEDENDNRDFGLLYATEVSKIITKAQTNKRTIAAYLVESLLSCGGQIILPPNYLRNVFRYVREAGGVCIADEVQVGFGRVGKHWWAFQLQGPDVIPDIVTLGKPMGNGYPLSAVITTPEIADSFANSGMEYFNTFGGSPVSCAVGLSVLRVMKNENLIQNATEVGSYLLNLLIALKRKYNLIGDVRGVGLFIGIELITNHQSKTPATNQAHYIVNKMKDHNIILSRDGPYKNVLKLKPPMVFNTENANYFVNKLDVILGELEKPFEY